MGNKSTAELFKDATLEDIAADPKKYGAPTFEEYLKHGSSIMNFNTEDGKMGLLDKGTQILRPHLRKIIYIVGGVKCKNPEMAQRVAADKNIDLRKYAPEMVDVGGGKHDIHLIFNTEKQQHGKLVGIDGRRLQTS